MMNDVSHVIEFFNQLPTSLQYDKVVSALAEQHGQERAEHYRKTFEDIQRMAIDGMENKLEEILKHVGKRVRSFIGINFRAYRGVYIKLRTLVPTKNLNL